MPTSNPVYQPTTVTYERHKEWSSNYITERVIPNCYQKPYLQRLLLVGAIMLAMVGLGLAIYALVNDVNTHKDEPEGPPVFEDNSEEDFEKEETSDSNEPGSHDHATNVVLGSIGITLILVSLVMYVMFLKLRGMCRGLLPHHHSHRSAGNMHSSGGQAIHNESDHPTVVSYKGVQQEPGALNLEPAAPMEEERHSLMDSKFQSEDTERMMDDDPRIVLKPLRTAEEA